jgi:tripartite-type tricarboxylate transporter receptor subunit TctC
LKTSRLIRRVVAPSAALSLALSLAACGGNLDSGSSDDGGSFPDGPVNLMIGQDPGGSTDLIGRALAKVASDELGKPMPVVNRPGANGAVAAQELAGKKPDGQNLMIINASLIAITPLAVSADEAIDIDKYEIVTGISQDDYVLVANPKSGYKSVKDLVDADKSLKFATTGVGTGSQLSQALLFKQAKIDGSDVPFDGGSPAITAVLGNQVDVASVQLGEAYPQIKAGKLTPLVTFSQERNTYLPDTPTATEEGYDVPVAQYRAVAVPKGTPKETVDKLRKAFQAAFDDTDYQAFNKKGLLTPREISGDEVAKQWTESRDTYKALIDKYDIDLGQAE